MNVIERVVYDLVKKNPELKERIVWLYQKVFSALQSKVLISDYSINVRPGFFYGFHDKCPWSPDNRYLLAHRFTGENTMDTLENGISIGYFKGEDWDNFFEVGLTKAWNWQTGSMLQWLGPDNDIIYNDFNGQNHISRMVNIEGKEIGELDKPIAAVSGNGLHAISHSFSRLRKYAVAYAYSNGINDNDNLKIPSDEYLYLLNIESGQTNALFNLKDIINLETDVSMDNAYHYFTHCLFNPADDRFVFLHRWHSDTGKVNTRMITTDLTGNELHIFPTNGMVSHIAWRDNDTILAYAGTSLGDNYYLFKDKSDDFSVLSETAFSEDGHPQYSSEGVIVTDTYPDKFRLQTLMVYDPQNDQKQIIARLKSPFSFRGSVRCDLHPRWDRLSSVICFDSAHTGKRSLCTIRLS